MKFAILGKGVFGEALGKILTDNKNEVEFYDPNKKTRSLDEVLKGAEAIVLAIPSSAVPEMLPKLPKDKTLIVATKGILNPEVFDGFEDLIVISGPGFAEDLMREKFTIWTTTDERAGEWFGHDWLYFDVCEDARGVLMCGALKNVFALIAGYKGLVQRTAKMDRYLEEANFELGNLILENGGDPMAAMLACGIGDTMLTCGPRSRNYQFGQKLKRDPEAEPTETVEGWETLKAIKNGAIKMSNEAIYINDFLAEGLVK